MTGTIGSLDRRDVKASVNIPITDKLLTKWTVADLYRDGYVHVLTTGQNNGGIDQKVFHGDILWMPTDKLTWRFNYQTDNNQFTEPRIQDAVFHGDVRAGRSGRRVHRPVRSRGSSAVQRAHADGRLSRAARSASGRTARRSASRTPSRRSSSRPT